MSDYLKPRDGVIKEVFLLTLIISFIIDDDREYELGIPILSKIYTPFWQLTKQ